MTNVRKITIAFVLGGLLAVGAFAAMGGVTADNHEPEAQNPNEHITVTASGSADAEADTAEITLAVEARNDDPSTARQEVADGASSMRAALMGMGISEDDIQSTGYTLREASSFERRENDVPRHYARHTFRVTVDDTGRAGEVIDTAVGNGATSVSGMSFTVSDERRIQLKQDALETAMDNARSQADAVADAGDITVTGVRSVSTVDTGFSPVRVEREQLEAADDAGTTVSPGPVEIDAQVEVVYGVSS
ncbi:MAG: SIMPL domain-containing protein [Halobacteriales archaeon]|nr:SIMPL domain-containing protein [Halobacteriales archaeon]